MVFFKPPTYHDFGNSLWNWVYHLRQYSRRVLLLHYWEAYHFTHFKLCYHIGLYLRYQIAEPEPGLYLRFLGMNIHLSKILMRRPGTPGLWSPTGMPRVGYVIPEQFFRDDLIECSHLFQSWMIPSWHLNYPLNAPAESPWDYQRANAPSESTPATTKLPPWRSPAPAVGWSSPRWPPLAARRRRATVPGAPDVSVRAPQGGSTGATSSGSSELEFFWLDNLLFMEMGYEWMYCIHNGYWLMLKDMEGYCWTGFTWISWDFEVPC